MLAEGLGENLVGGLESDTRLGNGLAKVDVITRAGAVTIVDAGMPGYWRGLSAKLAAMGRSLEDMRAVKLHTCARRSHRFR
jgi:hypothetical protein